MIKKSWIGPAAKAFFVGWLVLAQGIISYAQPRAGVLAEAFTDYGYLLKTINDRAGTTDLARFRPIRPGADVLAGHRLITASLPKARKAKRSPEDVFTMDREAVLCIGNYYLCDHCSNLHAQLDATAVVLTADGLCLTNYHVLESLLGLGRPSSDSAQVPAYIFTADVEGNIYPITELLTFSVEGDAALFRIQTGGKRLSPMPLGPTARVGAKVSVISHPHGINHLYYYSQGSVARNAITDRSVMDSERMEITADYAAGSSGGPIIDECGNLAGLVCSTIPLYTYDQQHPMIQMVVKSTIPVHIIKALFL